MDTANRAPRYGPRSAAEALSAALGGDPVGRGLGRYLRDLDSEHRRVLEARGPLLERLRAVQLDQRRNRPGGWWEAVEAYRLWDVGLGRAPSFTLPRGRWQGEALRGQIAAAWLADRVAYLRLLVVRAARAALNPDVRPNGHGHLDWRLHLGEPVAKALRACGLTFRTRGRREALALLVEHGTTCPPAPPGGWPDHWRAFPGNVGIQYVGRPPWDPHRRPAPAMRDAVHRLMVSALDWDRRYWEAWRKSRGVVGPEAVDVPPLPDVGERVRRRLRRLSTLGRHWERENGAAEKRVRFWPVDDQRRFPAGHLFAPAQSWSMLVGRVGMSGVWPGAAPPFEPPPDRRRQHGQYYIPVAEREYDEDDWIEAGWTEEGRERGERHVAALRDARRARGR